MSGGSKKDTNDFEVVDVSQNARDRKEWLKATLKDLGSASKAKQMCVGGGAGWCCGYLSCKVGKSAAMAVGGGLLLLQVASHQGYITVNWGKLERNFKRVKKDVQKGAERRLPAVAEEVIDFIQENVVLATGFAGGFLIGLASA